MNSKRLAWVLFAVIVGFCVGWGMMWTAQAYGGEFVTYTDSKTGVKYYGDAVPPSAPTNARIEVRKHESIPVINGNSPAIDYRSPIVKPEPATRQPESLRMDPFYERSTHRFNEPIPPARGRTADYFNKVTGAHEKYQTEFLDWRMKGHDIGYDYRPTGFSQGERRHYESMGSFDRAFRRR